MSGRLRAITTGGRARALRLALVLGALAVVMSSCGGESAPAELPCPPGTPGCELRQQIHEHADFALFIRGHQFDFGRPEFISVEGHEKSENVHIHDPRHTVVHVHREQTTWDEFLRSLGFELTDPTVGTPTEKACLKLPAGERLCTTATESFKFVMNGVRIDGIADLDIAGLSRLLISYGSESEADVFQNQWPRVSDEACIPAGVCQARGSGAGEHGEPCAKASGQCN
jgi:hypothetical protein